MKKFGLYFPTIVAFIFVLFFSLNGSNLALAGSTDWVNGTWTLDVDATIAASPAMKADPPPAEQLLTMRVEAELLTVVVDIKGKTITSLLRGEVKEKEIISSVEGGGTSVRIITNRSDSVYEFISEGRIAEKNVIVTEDGSKSDAILKRVQ